MTNVNDVLDVLVRMKQLVDEFEFEEEEPHHPLARSMKEFGHYATEARRRWGDNVPRAAALNLARMVLLQCTERKKSPMTERQSEKLNEFQNYFGKLVAEVNRLEAVLPMPARTFDPQAAPPQVIAPFRYALSDDRVYVLDIPANGTDRDVESIAAARSALIDQARMIAHILLQSNHTMLIPFYSDLQGRLESATNIIQLGVSNQMCRSVTSGFDEELSSQMMNIFLGHLDSISSYVAQFPEWQRYSQQAAEATISNADFNSLVKTSRLLALSLRGKINIDDSVPSSFEQVANWGEMVKSKPSGSVILAVVSTLSNFVSIVVREVVKLPGDVLSEARKAVSKAILAAILGVTTVTGLRILGALPDYSWVSGALEYLLVASTSFL